MFGVIEITYISSQNTLAPQNSYTLRDAEQTEEDLISTESHTKEQISSLRFWITTVGSSQNTIRISEQFSECRRNYGTV